MSLLRQIPVFLVMASPVMAQDLRLTSPLDCDLTSTCFIQQFTDHDPGPGARDFTCGNLSYDGHKGTDFALPSLAMQAAGVAVVASAPGTVRAVRDGMADILQGSPNAPDVSQVECGNGVVIDHPGGWETQYCHMAMGSIAVTPGQMVTPGTRLGLVGLSGQTQFPHVHLSVRKDGDIVDPFDPSELDTCGDDDPATLWVDPIATPPGGIISAGWSTDVPQYDAVKAGTADLPLAADQPLVLWGYFFGGLPGDLATLTITGPQGEVFTQDITLERAQAQLFRAGGRRAQDGGWPKGEYLGQITHSRDGTLIDQIEIAASID